MTTTIRPIGPEEQTADGARSRSYDICVNSRPVGVIRLATDTRYGPSAGRIGQLVVEERERRRGRATVAALAAEEVLRSWGCNRVELSVPDRAGAALRMAQALGYREGNRTMLKELDEEPPLPPGSTVRPMTDAEYPAWQARDRDMMLRSLLDRGVPRAQAEARADVAAGALLPQGPATEGAALRVLEHEGAAVGTLWVNPLPRTEGATEGWVYSVEVAEEARGRGHGRTLMLAAERECLAAGSRALGLNVFVGNTPACHLYASLGYRTTEHHCFKPLL